MPKGTERAGRTWHVEELLETVNRMVVRWRASGERWKLEESEPDHAIL